jgi:hypothetical protein
MTVRSGNTRRPSGTWAMPAATTRSGGSRSMRVPSKRISPDVSRARPEMARRVVVLPAPLAPMMVTMPPSGTSSETPLRAATLW